MRVKRNVAQRINFCRKIDNLEIISGKTTQKTQNDTAENSQKSQKQTFKQKNKNQIFCQRAARSQNRNVEPSFINKQRERRRDIQSRDKNYQRNYRQRDFSL